MMNSLLGSASVWYGKFSCAGVKPQAESRYDTSRTGFYRIIPPLHLITNSISSVCVLRLSSATLVFSEQQYHNECSALGIGI